MVYYKVCKIYYTKIKKSQGQSLHWILKIKRRVWINTQVECFNKNCYCHFFTLALNKLNIVVVQSIDSTRQPCPSFLWKIILRYVNRPPRVHRKINVREKKRIIKERNKTATCKPMILKGLIIDISKIKLWIYQPA